MPPPRSVEATIIAAHEPVGRMLERAEQHRAGIRAQPEHSLHVIRNPLRHRTVRCRSLARNEAHLCRPFGLPTS